VKFFCQNAGDTNEWASKLLGERYKQVLSSTVGQSAPQTPDANERMSSGVSVSDQKRRWIEPARFATLARGGPRYDSQVECICYPGGAQFEGQDEDGQAALLPYLFLTFNQS